MTTKIERRQGDPEAGSECHDSWSQNTLSFSGLLNFETIHFSSQLSTLGTFLRTLIIISSPALSLLSYQVL
jgi:hypothetical protein